MRRLYSLWGAVLLLLTLLLTQARQPKPDSQLFIETNQWRFFTLQYNRRPPPKARPIRETPYFVDIVIPKLPTRYIYVGGVGQERLFDALTGDFLPTLPVPPQARLLAAAPRAETWAYYDGLNLYLHRLDGTMHRLDCEALACKGAISGALSADGTRLYFVRYDEALRGSAVYVLGIDGTKPASKLSALPVRGGIYSLLDSPTLYFLYQTDRLRLAFITPEGAFQPFEPSLEALPHLPLLYLPAPDGQKVAILADLTDANPYYQRAALYVVGADGRQVTRLPDIEGGIGNLGGSLAWSWASEWLFFSVYNGEAYRIRPTGGTPLQVTRQPTTSRRLILLPPVNLGWGAAWTGLAGVTLFVWGLWPFPFRRGGGKKPQG